MSGSSGILPGHSNIVLCHGNAVVYQVQSYCHFPTWDKSDMSFTIQVLFPFDSDTQPVVPRVPLSE